MDKTLNQMPESGNNSLVLISGIVILVIVPMHICARLKACNMIHVQCARPLSCFGLGGGILWAVINSVLVPRMPRPI
jgi:hypothetical protein